MAPRSVQRQVTEAARSQQMASAAGTLTWRLPVMRSASSVTGKGRRRNQQSGRCCHDMEFGKVGAACHWGTAGTAPGQGRGARGWRPLLLLLLHSAHLGTVLLGASQQGGCIRGVRLPKLVHKGCAPGQEHLCHISTGSAMLGVEEESVHSTTHGCDQLHLLQGAQEHGFGGGGCRRVSGPHRSTQRTASVPAAQLVHLGAFSTRHLMPAVQQREH